VADPEKRRRDEEAGGGQLLKSADALAVAFLALGVLAELALVAYVICR